MYLHINVCKISLDSIYGTDLFQLPSHPLAKLLRLLS